MSKILALLGLITWIAACDNKKDESSSELVQPPADVTPVVPVPEVTATSVPEPAPLPAPGPEVPPILNPNSPGAPTPGPEGPAEPVPVPPTPTPSPSPSPEPTPVPPAPEPAPVLSALTITLEGEPTVGSRLQIRTMATWENPSETKEVTAELSFLQNEAAAKLYANGGLRASKHGLAEIEASFEGKKATVAVQFEYPFQFWVYREDSNGLQFNTPWDKTEGDEIKRSVEGIPDYALTCLKKSQKALAEAEASGALKWNTLASKGATDKLVYLVNVVSRSSRITALRNLDRDAYFWHWTSETARPYLAMSNFKKGSFVFEVVASPQGCVLPSIKEAQRYVDYADNRLSRK